MTSGIKDGKIPTERMETDCMDNCNSRAHGRLLCSLGTGTLTNNVVALWMKTCSNYAHVVDSYGRSCLHIVSSTGNHDALGWLIKRAGSDIDKKDKISGYTSLHRSIYFGQIHIARTLMKYNADLNLKDNEGMTPLELCHADRPRPFQFKIRSDPTELFVWGTNDNYTLGNTMQQARPIPEQVELFRKNNTRIMQTVFCTYHSVFLTQLGEVYVCGSGQGGKLGLGHESSVLIPEIVHFKSKSKCDMIAAAVDHTLFLMDNNKVLSCGSNERGLIGHKPHIKELLFPKNIDFPQKEKIKGVLAARYHSVFYTSRKILTCGTNRGQMGHSPEKGTIIYEPKIVSQISLDPETDVKFTHLACSDHATVARTSSGLVYIFHRFDCQKINTKHLNIEKMQVIGGSFGDSLIQGSSFKEEKSINDKPLTLLMLTSTGRIVIWREPLSSGGTNGTFTRIIFNTGRTTPDISDFWVSHSCLMIVSTSGEAYKSLWKPNSTPVLTPSFQQKVNISQTAQTDFQISSGSRRTQKGKDCSMFSIYLEHVKLQRIKNVYAAGSITCDSNGKNFAIIQASPKLDLTELPEVLESTINTDIAKFYEEITEEDFLHDVIFQIGIDRFPAHRFIIASNCFKLNDIILKIAETKPNERIVVVPIEDIHTKVFGNMLQYLYSGTCDLLTPGKRIIGSEDWIRLTIDAARKLDIGNLSKELRRVEIIDHIVVLRSGESFRRTPAKRFNYNEFQDLTDILLQNPAGHTFRAHRCILVARMEYFHSMLYANSWLEKDSTKPLTLQLSKTSIRTLLDYTYTDEAPNMPKDDFNELSEILAMSDTFFMERLRTLTEYALTDLLSLKNVVQMLYLADRCNAAQLKVSCMQFISLNLSSVLENRILDPLPMDIVKSLSEYYCTFHPIMQRRLMKHDSEVPTIEEYEAEMHEMLPEFFNELQLCSQDDEIKRPPSKPNKNKLRLRSRTSESEADISSNLNNSGTSTEENFVNITCDSPKSFDPSFVTDTSSSSPECSSSHNIKNKNAAKINFPTPSQTLMYLKNAEANESAEFNNNKTLKLNPSDFPTLFNNKGSQYQSKNKVNSKQNGVHLQRNINSQEQTNEELTKHSAMSINTPVRNRTTSGPSGNSGNAKKKIRWKTISISDEKDPEPSQSETISSSTQSSLRDPENPWKTSDTTKVVFREIVQEEVEKKENFERAVTKSLSLMQIEDQAINELMDNYNSIDVQDGIELVTVERLCSKNYANPTWVQHQHSGMSITHWPKFAQ